MHIFDLFRYLKLSANLCLGNQFIFQYQILLFSYYYCTYISFPLLYLNMFSGDFSYFRSSNYKITVYANTLFYYIQVTRQQNLKNLQLFNHKIAVRQKLLTTRMIYLQITMTFVTRNVFVVVDSILVTHHCVAIKRQEILLKLNVRI